MSVILHIEDEMSVRLLYREVFEELGYEIIEAVDAEEALKLLKSSRPDIIILDLKMPGIGGRGFLDKFQRLKLKIPIVISTAYPYFEDDPASLAADAFVVKSGDMGDLVDTVHALLARQ
jgi:CheY-like chemotaxis protein